MRITWCTSFPVIVHDSPQLSGISSVRGHLFGRLFLKDGRQGVSVCFQLEDVVPAKQGRAEAVGEPPNGQVPDYLPDLHGRVIPAFFKFRPAGQYPTAISSSEGITPPTRNS